MNIRKKLFIIFCTFIFLIPTLNAESLEIGTIVSPPFVMEGEENSYSGFSIELWTEITKKLNIDYSLVAYDTISEMIEDTKNGEVDLSIADILITSKREKELDFSNPILDSGLAFMVHTSSQKSESFFSFLFKMPSIIFIGFLILLPIIFYYIIPKKRFNKKKYVYIFLYILICCSIFSGLYTHYVITNINSRVYDLSTLPEKQIGVIVGSTGEKFTKGFSESGKSYETIEELYSALENGEIEVIIHDFPVLSYKSIQQSDFQVVGETFKKVKYGIAFPEHSKLEEAINIAILELKDSGVYETIYIKYFGNN